MTAVTLVVPGALATRTGGSIYDCRIVQGLRGRGWTVPVIELDAIAHPLAPPLRTAPAQFATIPDGSVVLVDGLAFGTMPEIIERESWRLRFVPIIHMALAATPGLTRGEAAWLSNLERRALAKAQHIVVTGARTKTVVNVMIDRFDDVTRIPPGVDEVLIPDKRRAETLPLRLLCVANLTWGKGYDILLRALASTPGTAWTLTCVGSSERDPAYAGHVHKMASDLGLEMQITWTGELQALDAEFDRADLFVLPTRGETYGMAIAEAIAHGVPVISTRTGEVVSIVGDGGALTQPGDAVAFASVLREAMTNGELRARLGDGARVAATRLPRWSSAVDAFEQVLRMVIVRG